MALREADAEAVAAVGEEVGLGRDAARYLIDNDWLPAHVRDAYVTLTADLLLRIEQRFAELTDLRRQLSDDQSEAFIGWGDSPAMRSVALIIEQVSDSDVKAVAEAVEVQ